MTVTHLALRVRAAEGVRVRVAHTRVQDAHTHLATACVGRGAGDGRVEGQRPVVQNEESRTQLTARHTADCRLPQRGGGQRAGTTYAAGGATTTSSMPARG